MSEEENAMNDETKPWQVHVTGPDEYLYFDTELEALREANVINKACYEKKWGSSNPELYPTVIAMVERNEAKPALCEHGKTYAECGDDKCIPWG